MGVHPPLSPDGEEGCRWIGAGGSGKGSEKGRPRGVREGGGEGRRRGKGERQWAVAMAGRGGQRRKKRGREGGRPMRGLVFPLPR